MESLAKEVWMTAAEVELVYKSKVKASQRPQITGSKDAYEVLMRVWDSNKIELMEEFKVLLMNRANKVLGVYELATGGITGTVADIRLIFAAALKACACSILVAHNHPSSNLTPSKPDIDLTEKLRQAGQLLDIKVLDHLIVHPEGFYSFADQGNI